MRRIALGLVCIVAAGGYAVGCSGTGSAPNGSGGHSGSGTGAVAGTTGSGGNAGSIGLGGSSGSGNAGSGNAGSGNGGDASASGGSGGGTQDAAVPDVVFSYDGPSDDGKQEACADLTVTAQPTPLDLYVMLDQSGSMSDPAGYPFGDCNIGGTTNSKWCHAINALSGFFHDSSAIGDRVALQYFMLDSGGACDGTGYDTPEIALGYLPQIASNLDSSLNAHSPHTDTPTQAAMNGIAKFTSTHQTPGRVMVGVLITDGDPCCGECNDNVSTIAQIPQNLYNNFGIRTFVIGMTGATFANLEQWAVAGGAPAHSNYCASGSSCHYYDVGNGDKTAFISALKAIQKSALGCQYNMPKTDAGITDPSKLAVNYTPSGGTAQALTNQGTKAACGNNDGFYFDNNQSPTTITLCPATCTKVQAASGGQVNITVPCQGS